MLEANVKAALSKLRHERREVKLTLRGLQDDPLLQESFAVLRSIQRRYQPCRTVCLSSNLTDGVIAAQQQRHSDDAQRHTSSSGQHSQNKNAIHRRLSAADKEAIQLRKTTSSSVVQSTNNDNRNNINDSSSTVRLGNAVTTSSSYWDAVEVEALGKLLEKDGLRKYLEEEEEYSSTKTQNVIGQQVPALGGKRLRSEEVETQLENSYNDNNNSASLCANYLLQDSYRIASRLHNLTPSSAPASCGLPFHALYDYAYGTNIGISNSPSGKFLVHCLQRQVALWFAGQLIKESKTAEGTHTDATSSSAGAASSSLAMATTTISPHQTTAETAATLLLAMEGIRIVPFFHEATRVASFAIIAFEADRIDIGDGTVHIVLIDPTIAVAERHLLQLLDSLGDTKIIESTSRALKVVIHVMLTHIPRDVQIGLAAVRSSISTHASSEAASVIQVEAAEPFVIYNNKNSCSPNELWTVLDIPLRKKVHRASLGETTTTSLVFTLVPSPGYSLDCAHIEMSLANQISVTEQSSNSNGQNNNDNDDNDNPTATPATTSLASSQYTVAAFLSPSVGLDGLCRLDYLTAELVNNGVRAGTDLLHSNLERMPRERYNRLVTNSTTHTPAGLTDDDLVAASKAAATLYHSTLHDMSTRYLQSLPSPSNTENDKNVNKSPSYSCPQTIGDGLVLFASRGGYNCSNGMLEAHWATTVGDLKHQQHTRTFWNAVHGAVETQTQGSNGGKQSFSSSSTAIASSPPSTSLDTFMAYLDSQKVFLYPLEPQMPKLLGSERNFQLNCAQLAEVGAPVLLQQQDNATSSHAPEQSSVHLLMAIDIRPHPEYLAHPTPNAINVPFLPLFAPSATVYAPQLPSSHASTSAQTKANRPHSLPSNIPVHDILGAKKPEQWLSSFVDMQEGDGLVLIIPDAEWTKIGEYFNKSAQTPEVPALLTHVANAATNRQLDPNPHHAHQAHFVLALFQRLQHIGIVPYNAISQQATTATNDENLLVTEICKVWVVGQSAYHTWLSVQQLNQPQRCPHHPFGTFSTKPYDHRSLRLNTSEDLGVMNLPTSMMQTILTSDGYVDSIEPPATLVVDIRTPAEFKNGSHRNSVHYAMWELLADWRREFVSAAVARNKRAMTELLHQYSSAEGDSPHQGLQAQSAHAPRWTERFGTKALDAGITAIMSSERNPTGPSIALYCAGGYRSHITASLLRSVPLVLEASGLDGETQTLDSERASPQGQSATVSPSHLAPARIIPTYYDVAGGAFQLMTQRPDLWHVKDRSVICVS